MSDITPQERDLIIRTIIGEAGDQPEDGRAAVAHVIRNRINDGSFGKNASQVILAPSQFEPWQTRAAELARISPKSEQYSDTGKIVDNVFSGKAPDNTGGATHFLQPDIVLQRSGKLPDWAVGQPTAAIGAHNFYRPYKASDFDSIFNELKTQKTQPAETTTSDFDQIFSDLKASKALPEAEKSAAAPVQTNDGSRIPVPVANMTPEQKVEYQASLARGRENPTILQTLRERIDPLTALSTAASKVKENAIQGTGLIQSGISSPNLLPTFGTSQIEKPNPENPFQKKSVEETTITDPGKLLGIAGGALGALGAPVTGPLDVAEGALTKATGNPEFASRASLVATLPTGGAEVSAVKDVAKAVPEVAKSTAQAVTDLTPKGSALKTIAGLVPEEYLPETIQTITRNPELTLVDVSRTARDHARVLAQDPLAPKAQQEILKFVDQGRSALPAQLQKTVEVLGELPDSYQVLQQIKTRAQQTGTKIINPIVENSKDANITNIVNDIDNIVTKAQATKLPLSPLQERLGQLREELRGGRADRDQMFREVKGEQGLHWLQSELRSEASNLVSSAQGSERTLGKKLMEWRNRLVDAIDAQNPGYKEALGKYRDDKQIAEAFDRGLKVNENKKLNTSEAIDQNSPEAWKVWASDPKTHKDELAAARLGALSWMKDELEGLRSGKKILESPKDKILSDRIEALFGKEASDNFINALHDTHRRAQAVSELNATGSDTVKKLRGLQVSPVRLPGKGESKPSSFLGPVAAGIAAEGVLPLLNMATLSGKPSLVGLTLGAGALGYKGMKGVAQQVRYRSDLARRLAEAKLLTTPISQQPDLLRVLQERAAGGPSKANLLKQIAGPE